MPTVEISMPTAPETRPLPMLSALITAMVDRPNRQSQKFSGPPNLRAKRAREAARKSRKKLPTIPPKEEDSREVYSASSARPAWHRGQPSKVVATEEGVPGVQIRMAEFAPP